jgi:hypothetical protein
MIFECFVLSSRERLDKGGFADILEAVHNFEKLVTNAFPEKIREIRFLSLRSGGFRSFDTVFRASSVGECGDR